MTHHKALIRRGHSPFGQQPLQVGRGWGGGGGILGDCGGFAASWTILGQGLLDSEFTQTITMATRRSLKKKYNV